MSKENKEMAEYYKKQQEQEAVKKAADIEAANAKAQKVVNSATGEEIPSTSNFVMRAKQINGKLLTYLEYTDDALTKHNMGKSLSDNRTAVLLSRYDNGEKLSLQEKQELVKKIRTAEARGEWYFYNDDEQEYMAIPYNTSYNGQSKSGVVLFELDKDIDVSIFGSGSAFDS